MHAMKVEERLRFYDDGVAPRKNATVMAEAIEKTKAESGDADVEPMSKPQKKSKKKRVSVCCLYWIQQVQDDYSAIRTCT